MSAINLFTSSSAAAGFSSALAGSSSAAASGLAWSGRGKRGDENGKSTEMRLQSEGANIVRYSQVKYK